MVPTTLGMMKWKTNYCQNYVLDHIFKPETADRVKYETIHPDPAVPNWIHENVVNKLKQPHYCLDKD